jgi:hypothetical protein
VAEALAITGMQQAQNLACEAAAGARPSTASFVQGATLCAAVGALAAAGQHQQACDLAQSISDPDWQAAAQATIAGALAAAGRRRQARDLTQSITHPIGRADALALTAEALARTRHPRAARVAAAACAAAPWTAAAAAVLTLEPAASAVLPDTLDFTWHRRLLGP